MRVLPRSANDRIAFFEAHLPIWAKNPAAIGLSIDLVNELAARTAAARADYDAVHALRSQARAATFAHTESLASMFDLGSDLVKVIRSFALANDNPSVFPAARIPPPEPASPLGPPAIPTGLSASLNTDGTVSIRWQASRRGGTSFAIERSLGSHFETWTLIGVAADTVFTDPAVPSGLEAVSYRVTAARSGGVSTASHPTTVIFGNIIEENGAAALGVAA
jgi:hypothetical protein